MDINLPYGKTFIQIDSNIGEILYPKNISKIRILEESIINSLEKPISSPPLSKLIKKSHKISLIIPDKTRVFPAKIILPVVLKYIEKNGKDQYIDIIIANGLHKPMSKDEIIELIGKNIYYIYNTINHISGNDEDQVNLNKKTSYDTPLIFNKNVYESDLKIGLGVIEPHFFAGYSGGGKSILPGVAGIEAIFKNHSYKMIGDKYSKYG
ncbi:MAG: lactate racemization operon protein LarA, partial [Thermoprotei archaeon]